jgi:hypothetical protein
MRLVEAMKPVESKRSLGDERERLCPRLGDGIVLPYDGVRGLVEKQT